MSNMKKRIAFLGDSLTHAGRWEEFFPNVDVFNHGIPGEISIEILSRLNDVLRKQPDIILVMMGINDLGSGINTKEILSHYSQLIDRVKRESKAKLIVQSLLPVNFQLFPITIFNAADILKSNDLLQSLCEKEEITFVDLYSFFTTDSNELMKEYTYDGLHLNHSGYRIWKNRLLSENLL